MKRLSLIFPALIFSVLIACNNNAGDHTASGDTTTKTADTAAANTGSVDGFKLGVQLWTFRMFSFSDALDKVDSAGIKNVEAFFGQKLGGNMTGEFSLKMSPQTIGQIKALLQKKGIQAVAMGVVTPKNRQEWIQAFDIAKALGMSYINSEPLKTQWDMVDSLAGAYNIPVGIHDHPKPNVYWSPDSVLAAIQGHPHIGSCADIGHWSRNGLNPVDCLKKLEGHIVGVHLKDIVKFDDTQAADTVVGMGVIQIRPVLEELKRQNFKGMLSIEHESNWYHSVPDVIFTRKYYDSLINTLH